MLKWDYVNTLTITHTLGPCNNILYGMCTVCMHVYNMYTIDIVVIDKKKIPIHLSI